MKRIVQSMKHFDTCLLQTSINNGSVMSSCVKMKKSKSSENLYIPQVPFFCPVTKKLRDNELVREILIYDKSKPIKPRLTWYDPNDNIIPNNWFVDGICSDLDYYFNQSNYNK